MQAWLGRLGSWADALALGPADADGQGQDISRRWDAKDMIGLKVSFPGMERANPVLWLDSLLPMVGAVLGSAQKMHMSPVNLAYANHHSRGEGASSVQ